MLNQFIIQTFRTAVKFAEKLFVIKKFLISSGSIENVIAATHFMLYNNDIIFGGR